QSTSSSAGSIQKGARLLDDLKLSVERGSVLAVIGTGVSIRTTENQPAASWAGLLREGIKWCLEVDRADHEWAERQLAALESQDVDELLMVGEQITVKLGGQKDAEFALWLRETIGAL